MSTRLPRRKSTSFRHPVRHARLRLELLEDRSLLDAALVPELLVTLKTGQLQTVPVEPGLSVEQALAAWQANPAVLAAEVDQTVSVSVIPNDPSFGSLWGLHNTGQSGGVADADIDAPEAWDSYTGGTNRSVGIIDTGVDYRHPDLYLNIWINQGEIPTSIRNNLTDVDGDALITFYDLNNPVNIGAGKITDLNGNGVIDGGDLLNNASGWENGVDNDPVAGNANASQIDDLIGWDFVNNDNDPLDDNNHGTHVAGTIGAIGNNGVGVAGVNWKTQMAGLKFLAANGSGAISNAVKCLDWAVGQGIQISNNSWGGGGFSSAFNTALNNAQAAGHVFVAAAGNSASNNETTPHYPSSYPQSNVVAVASTTRTEGLSSFSSFGATTVDLGAPGSSILSTTPNNTYSTFSGTSMATPHVAGAIALVWSQSPTLTYTQVINRILGNVNVTTALTGRVATNGRLNVQRALNTTPPPVDLTGPRITAAASSGSPVSSVRVTFSEAINPASFTTGDVTLTGPGGAVTITGVTAVTGSNNTQFDFTFMGQSTAGVYTFVVGPDVRDTAGNQMDQNQNGSNGEAADTFTSSFTVQAGPQEYTRTHEPGLAIRDFQTTTSTINVPNSFTIADLNVRLNLTHTWDRDLRIRLRAPNGTIITLSNRRGGSGDNFTNTVFDDEASTAIAAGAAPFSGSFRPDGALSSFDGLNASGTWTLTVFDAAGQDVGSLLSWTLSFTAGGGGASINGGATVGEFAPSIGAIASRLQAPFTVSSPSMNTLAAFLVEHRTTRVTEQVRARAFENDEFLPWTSMQAQGREADESAVVATSAESEAETEATFGEETPDEWTW